MESVFTFTLVEATRRPMVRGLAALLFVGGAASGVFLLRAPAAGEVSHMARGIERPIAKGGAAPSAKMSNREIEMAVGGVQGAYDAGRYREAEARALQVVKQTSPADSVVRRREAAQAQSLLAYAAARRNDKKLSKVRFAELRRQAAKLPDGGRIGSKNSLSPTLEEDAAYQHAILTGALGDKAGAEKEYRAYMLAYPESPLVHGVVMRLRRFHEGNVPPDAEKVWRQARAVAQKRHAERERSEALCGPECLAELLRRRGDKPVVETLAKGMHTGVRGTTMQALADSARKHGYAARGLSVTWDGLRQQKLPLIALIRPGHFVLVEEAGLFGVSVWDPSGQGSGQGAVRRYSSKEWQRIWQGAILAL